MRQQNGWGFSLTEVEQSKATPVRRAVLITTHRQGTRVNVGRPRSGEKWAGSWATSRRHPVLLGNVEALAVGCDMPGTGCSGRIALGLPCIYLAFRLSLPPADALFSRLELDDEFLCPHPPSRAQDLGLHGWMWSFAIALAFERCRWLSPWGVIYQSLVLSFAWAALLRCWEKYILKTS